jgi:hypothetical protein
VLVRPSPKFQLHDVGLPVDISVNWIACPAVGPAGAYVNEEASTDTEATVMVLLAESDPELVVASRLTIYSPALAKAWVGFFTELVAPSPKLQDQEVGLPDVVSVNCTVWPGPGVVGVNTKDAAPWAATTATVRDEVLEFVLSDAVRVTRRKPDAE